MKLVVAVGRELFGWVVLLLFWLREIAGWILLVLGLLIFYECFALMVATPPRFIQVLPLTFLGFIIFRAGIHMLKVSAAALICLRTQEQLAEAGERNAVRRPAARTRIHHAPFELGPR
jgi:hypothetical protein